jgi:hypothetical protein
MPLQDAPAPYEPVFWQKVHLHTHDFRSNDYERDNKIYTASIFYDEECDVYVYELERDPSWPVEWLIKYDKIKRVIYRTPFWGNQPSLGDVACSIAMNEPDFRSASLLSDELRLVTFRQWNRWSHGDFREDDEEEYEEENEEEDEEENEEEVKDV